MHETAPSFQYEQAFARNLGWLTASEQQRLREARVAIAGLGGVGGVHLLTLARLGIGRFQLSDFDHFSLANFNRQAGAAVSTLDRSKLAVMQAQALDINPGLDIATFPEGVGPDNLDRFLDGVDVYVDGLDFFAFQARRAVFAACRARGIPAVTVAPLGMGAALLTFLPQGCSFDAYFDWHDGLDEQELALRFALGLAPAGLHRAYLVDPSRVSFAERRGPSTAMACQLCAGLAGTEVLKLVLGRGKVRAAPHGWHIDAYSLRARHTWLPGGNRNPLQRIKLALGRRFLARHAGAEAPQETHR
ncbi:MAG: hypothetical protein RLY78_3284 [Pseudomonadota bacterium]